MFRRGNHFWGNFRYQLNLRTLRGLVKCALTLGAPFLFSQTIFAQTTTIAVPPTTSTTSASPGTGVSTAAAAAGSEVTTATSAVGATPTPSSSNKIVETDPVTGRVIERAAGKVEAWKFSTLVIANANSTINTAQPQLSRDGQVYSLVNVSHSASGLQGRMFAGRSQNFTYRQDDGTGGDWIDPSFSVGHGFKIKGLDAALLRVNTSLPVSRTSQRTTYQGSSGATIILSKSLGRWSLTPRMDYIRRYYQYEITREGKTNNPHLVSVSLNASYQVNDRIILSAGGGLERTLSFQNVAKANSNFSLSGTYIFTDAFSGNLGVSTSSSTLNSDGQTSRIQVYDTDLTQVYAALALSIQ